MEFFFTKSAWNCWNKCNEWNRLKKKWTSSTETTETMEMNRKLMKHTVTISNKHLQEIFCRLNLPETAETSVTNETGLKKLDIFYRNNWNNGNEQKTNETNRNNE